MKIRYALYGDDERLAPTMANAGDACYDLKARCYSPGPDFAGAEECLSLPPLGRCLARTGVFLQLEEGWEAQVRPRSGNALKKGLTVLNSPGTVDAGYRDEIGVILYNAGGAVLELARGMKIAQIAFRRLPELEMERIAHRLFDAATMRNLKGFGSSGQ